MLKTRLVVGTLLALSFAGGLSFPFFANAQTCDPATPPLCANEVQAIIERATEITNQPLVVAVVDRVGSILGVFRKAGAPAQVAGNFSGESLLSNSLYDAGEVAVSLARTAAFFSHNQAPLTSRTVRFISGVHFPPGVLFTPNAALYGIENTNRGCDFNATFNDGKKVCTPPPCTTRTVAGRSSPSTRPATRKPGRPRPRPSRSASPKAPPPPTAWTAASDPDVTL